jgi:hypothetical protein
MPEHQNIEYKSVWKDEYLKWEVNIIEFLPHILLEIRYLLMHAY